MNAPPLRPHPDCSTARPWRRHPFGECVAVKPSRRAFVVHSEPGASDALRGRFADELGWLVQVPAHLAGVAL